MLHSMKEATEIPDPNGTNASTGGDGLAKNLEFLMLKVAQLETAVELQQVEIRMGRTEIKRLNKKLDEYIGTQPGGAAPPGAPSLLQTQAEEKVRLQQAQAILKKVFHKHQHQREKREFVTPMTEKRHQDSQSQAKESKEQLLQRQQKKASSQKSEGQAGGTELDAAVSSKIIGTVVDAVVDGAESFGGAIAEGYEQTSDKVAFVANTVIDTTEKAMQILTRGFTFDADCDLPRPTSTILSTGFRIGFGGASCSVTLVGQKLTLYDFAAQTLDLPFPVPFIKECKLPHPTAGISSSGLDLSFGSARCVLDIFGRELVLFNDAMPSYNLPWPEPLASLQSTALNAVKGAFKLGQELVSCASGGPNYDSVKCVGNKIMDRVLGCPDTSSIQSIMICLGSKTIEYVPPFKFLTMLNIVLGEFVEGFARVAGTVVRQVLKGSHSLIQEAAKSSKFPAVGAPPVTHHAEQNLMIQIHTEKRNLTARDMSLLQSEGDPKAGIAFAFGSEGGHEQTKLISQWGGTEKDTSSCLAFAPKHKSGAGGQATTADWQVNSQGDFVSLEPWAVPCDPRWMKDHWDKWQGYSFYTGSLAVEKCLTVSFSFSVQPSISLVGGLTFEVMPSPLATVETTVCWPRGRPGGLDLSLLRTSFKSSGVLLYERTLRLTKRFGSGTTWDPQNVKPSSSSWETIANPREKISRTNLLQSNQSSDMEEGVWQWMMDPEELYLASASYSLDSGLKITSELKGQAAAQRLAELRKARQARRAREHRKAEAEEADEADEESESSLMSTKTDTEIKDGEEDEAEAQADVDVFQLFKFEKPGDINFNLAGVLDGNIFELRTQMGFGPYRSVPRDVHLVDVVQQFKVVLQALPFVSQTSADKAIEVLNHFSSNSFPPPLLIPGTTVGLHSKFFNEYINVHANGNVHGSGHTPFGMLPSHAVQERWTVVDAGNGRVALYNQRWSSFLCVGPGNVHTFPASVSRWQPTWTNQIFEVVNVGDGEIALFNHDHKAFVKMLPGHGMSSVHFGGPPETIPDGWRYERFHVDVLKPMLQPGAKVGLYSAANKRWLRMNGWDMDRSEPSETWTPGWDWEEFTVVDAGKGEIALHNTKWNGFVKMWNDPPSPHYPHHSKVSVTPGIKAEDLPDHFAWERFQVIPLGHNEVALHNAEHNRFLSMNVLAGDIFGSPVRNPKDLPEDWAWERWQVVEVQSASSPIPGWRPGSVLLCGCAVSRLSQLIRLLGVQKERDGLQLTWPQRAQGRSKCQCADWERCELGSAVGLWVTRQDVRFVAVDSLGWHARPAYSLLAVAFSTAGLVWVGQAPARGLEPRVIAKGKKKAVEPDIKITPRSEDWSAWYLDVISAADLIDDAPVRGCKIFKPNGFAVWEGIQRLLDPKIKAMGVQNAYFPVLIPVSFLSKEASHVDGFAKECAVVTHHRLRSVSEEAKAAGGPLVEVDPESKLTDPYVVRPTSETVVWHMYSKWISSYRDLPLKLNQWANVMRWEMKTRPFLRTSEFLWQEGHTAHATYEEADDQAKEVLGVYLQLAEDELCLPIVPGRKSNNERFAGAAETYTIEALTPNGMAIQAGTSHFLGQNFAKAFDVTYSTEDQTQEYVWASSWG
ncbi:proS, partial [Symbiodinium sp. CCMP2592]